jgi:predicted small lipoprotein YifL
MPMRTPLMPCLAMALLLTLAGCRHTGSMQATDSQASTANPTATTATKEGTSAMTTTQQAEQRMRHWETWPIREGHSPERAWQGVLHLLRTVPRFADITPEIASQALGMPSDGMPPPRHGYSARIHADWAMVWFLNDTSVVPEIRVFVDHRPLADSAYMDPAPVCDGPTDWVALRPELEAMGFTLWAQWGPLDHSTDNGRYALFIDLLPSTQLNGRLCIKGITIQPMPQKVRP